METIEFTAKVIEKFERDGKYFVVLDKTLFYPDHKGGQLGDTGYIGPSKVLKVIEEKGKILHQVESLDIEGEALCKIDIERRMDVSREHTAQHILSQALERLFNIHTLSFHMDENYSTIDIDKEKIDQDQIKEAEYLSNKIVMENRKVKKYYVSQEELEKLNIRKKVDIEEPIRIVEVEDFDISMCGGTHVDNTGEIGIIKVLKTEKIKKEYTRIYFASGFRALREFDRKITILSSLTNELTTGETELQSKIKKLITENKTYSNQIRKLEEELSKFLLEKLSEKQTISSTLSNISRKTFESLAINLKKQGKDGFLALNNVEQFLIALLSKTDIPSELKVYKIGDVMFLSFDNENSFKETLKELETITKEGEDEKT